ncbi:hypothetical protein DEJ50_33430 [Streptomyces venezuelae]|uniref:DUF4259 domain-containing protein n=1 Tax=Streptomyces venezuelae TaxID=54571 RepID=A0A5P2DA16_STRVZ|nr:DUF4259 domain-containing protein [Streptomyces venezuelae]QES52002.1 hypothetical protein DEJ50_33430 [Streptomyces venezuelae]
MGTWDAGPFDNDTAADFCDALDDAPAGDREGLIRDTLIRALDVADDLDASISEEAIAAAALIAAQCPGGVPAGPPYGPKCTMPDLTSLRSLAVQVLDRVMSESSELLELWDGTHGSPWRANIHRLQNVLLPQPPGEQLRLI